MKSQNEVDFFFFAWNEQAARLNYTWPEEKLIIVMDAGAKAARQVER